MFTLSGRVVLKGSGVGIRDLVVVAYDVDPSCAPATGLHGLLAKVLSATSRDGLASIERGERLGSVLTGADGGFIFRFDERAFKKGDPERRPDLMLLVLAPEDVGLGRGSKMTPAPPEERVVYCSAAPIYGSGASESCLIRLPPELLDKFDIHYPGRARPREETVVAQSLERAASLSKVLGEVRTREVKARLAPALARRDAVKAAFREFSLSSFDPALRKGPLYASRGESVRELQAISVEQRLLQIGSELDAGVPRSLRLPISAQQASNWGLAMDPDGYSAEGKVPVGLVLDEIRATIARGPLERSRPWTEVACAKLRAPNVLRDAIGHCGDDPPATGPNPTNGEVPPLPEDSLAVVRSEAAKQLTHVTPPEIELQYGEAKHGEVTATITRPGPADVTAYHDFHRLEIALEHTWSEAFDTKLTGLFEELYSEMVKFKHRVSGVEESPPSARWTTCARCTKSSAR